MIKKFIRGNKERASEVIKALTDLGASNNQGFDGESDKLIYYIDEDNEISAISLDDNSFVAKLIQECFEEIVLEEKKEITNVQFAAWYFDQLNSCNVVQYRRQSSNCIENHLYSYVDDFEPCLVTEVRIDFEEWIPIEKAGII